MRIDLECGLGPLATGTYDVTLRLPGASPKSYRRVPCAAGFQTLACVVVMSLADAPTVFYLDNVSLRNPAATACRLR